jgi:hypothetical protein
MTREVRYGDQPEDKPAEVKYSGADELDDLGDHDREAPEAAPDEDAPAGSSDPAADVDDDAGQDDDGES